MEKKLKNVLKKNESKLFELSTTELQKITDSEIVDKDALIKKLVTENIELKLLFDDAQEQISKKLKAGGSYVFEIGAGVVDIIPNIKVLPDSQLKYKRKTVDIDEPEKVVRMKGFFGNKQFRAWFVEPEGEYTYDPRDKTPIEIKKRSEAIIKIKNEMAKSSFIQNILRGLAGIKKWFEYIPWIVFGASLTLMSFALVWWLSGYSLTKV